MKHTRLLGGPKIGIKHFSTPAVQWYSAEWSLTGLQFDKSPCFFSELLYIPRLCNTASRYWALVRSVGRKSWQWSSPATCCTWSCTISIFSSLLANFLNTSFVTIMKCSPQHMVKCFQSLKKLQNRHQRQIPTPFLQQNFDYSKAHCPAFCRFTSDFICSTAVAPKCTAGGMSTSIPKNLWVLFADHIDKVS